jgi:putative ABC transport system permease protein
LELSLASESHSDPDGAARLALRVTGVLTTGGAEDDQIFVPLAAAQQWAGLPDMARTVAVSALIKPEDDLSRKGPARMTPTEYDRWYCSPYLSSILHQIGEALPETSARAVRQVAETQGSVLGKLNFLMGLLAVVALAMATLSISSLAGLSVLERRHEIGLMKALGAQDGLVAGFFLAETAFQGLAGGLLGFAASELLARALAQAVFGVTIETHWMVLPATLLVALTVSLTGAWLPIRRAVAANPSQVLRGA